MRAAHGHLEEAVGPGKRVHGREVLGERTEVEAGARKIDLIEACEGLECRRGERLRGRALAVQAPDAKLRRIECG